MNFSQFKSIHEINAQEWDSILGPRDIIHSHAFAAALEESNLNCEFRYIVMRDSTGEMTAHANLCLVATPLDLFLSRESKTAQLLDRIRKYWSGFLMSKVVECGSPIALGPPIVFRNDLHESHRTVMVQAIQQAMSAFAVEGNADLLVVRDFSTNDRNNVSWRGFTEGGYVAAPNLENTVLNIKWSSFEDYVKSLRSSYRRRARSVIQSASNAGVRRERVVDFSVHADRLAELWKATSDQANSQLRENLSSEFFSNISQRLGNRTFVTLFWRGDTIVAFTLYFDNGDVLIPLYIGVDYAHNSEASLVFNANFDWVQTAIELGYRKLDLGITTYTPKMRVGAHLEPLTVLVRHRYSWLTLPTVSIYRWLTPQQEISSNNVFRQPQPLTN